MHFGERSQDSLEPIRATEARTGSEAGITRAWWLAVLVLCFAIPFEMVDPVVQLGSLVALTSLKLWIILALGVWAIRQIAVRQLPHLRVPLGIPSALLLGVIVFSASVAPSDRISALKAAARWGTGTLVFIMLVEAVQSGLPVRRVVGAMATGGLVVGGLALAEATGPSLVLALLAPFRNDEKYTVSGRIRACSTLLYPNSTAMYLEVVFFLSCGLLARQLRKHKLVTACACVIALAVVCGGLILTFTRTAWMVVPCCVIAVIAGRWREAKFDHVARAMIAGLVIFTLALLAAAFMDPVMRLRLRIGTSPNGTADSTENFGWQRHQGKAAASLEKRPDNAADVEQPGLHHDGQSFERSVALHRAPEFVPSRMDLWTAGLRMFEQHPILGVGPGNYRLVLRHFIECYSGDVFYAHNLYLEFLADTGIVGVVVFVGFVCFLLRLIWQMADGVTPASGTGDESIWLASASGALFAFLLHGITDYFLAYTGFYLLFWMNVAIVAALADERSRGLVGATTRRFGPVCLYRP
jgi:hypothetical protein